MKFLEEITATAGQLVKDLEHHMEKYPQIASEIVTVYIDDSYSITGSYVNNTSKDCHDNLIDFICFEHDWDKRDEGITVAKMLELLKTLDPDTGVLFDEGEETLGETDSGLRNLYPEPDENPQYDGIFICCDADGDSFDIFCRIEDEEINCLSGYYPKK